jgi:hypothetical protein
MRFLASAQESCNGAQIISFGCGTGDHRWTGRGVQIGGYRAWPTELRFTLSSCSAKLREILCSWPGVATGSWP